MSLGENAIQAASYRSSIIHFVSTETEPPRSEQISASKVEKNGRINCAYFLNKTSFYSGSLLRAESRWTTTTAKKKRKMRNRGRAEEASRSSWRIERNRGERKRGKKRGDEINNFPEFKVFCRRHFSLVSTRLRAREKERGRESTLSLVFLLLLRENEIDPLLIVDLKKIEILVSVYPAIFLYSARFPASASSTTLTLYLTPLSLFPLFLSSSFSSSRSFLIFRVPFYRVYIKYARARVR